MIRPLMTPAFWTRPCFNWLDEFDFFSLASPKTSAKALYNSWCLPFCHPKPRCMSHQLHISSEHLVRWWKMERISCLGNCLQSWTDCQREGDMSWASLPGWDYMWVWAVLQNHRNAGLEGILVAVWFSLLPGAGLWQILIWFPVPLSCQILKISADGEITSLGTCYSDTLLYWELVNVYPP